LNSSGAVWVLALAVSVAAHWGLLASITGAAVAPAPSPPTELVIEDQPALAPTLNAPVVQDAGVLDASVASPPAVEAVAESGALSQAPESVIAAVAPSGPETRVVEHPVTTAIEPPEGSQAPEPRVSAESVDDAPRASPLPSTAIDENRNAETAQSSRPAELAPSTPDVGQEQSPTQSIAAAPEPGFAGPAETSETAAWSQADSAEPAPASSLSEARSEIFILPAQNADVSRARADEQPAPVAPNLTSEAVRASEDTGAVRPRADEDSARVARNPDSKTARRAEDGGPTQAVSSSAAEPAADTTQTARRQDARRLEPTAALRDKILTGVEGSEGVRRSESYETVGSSAAGAAESIAPVAGRPSLPEQLAPNETANLAAPVSQSPISEERVALAPPQPPIVIESEQPEPETPALEMASYIREYEGGPCFFALPVALDESQPEIEGFATNADVVRSFGRSFRDRFHIEPKLDVREVTDIQCHAISFIQRVLKSPTPEITVSLDRDTIPGGASLKGTVEGVRQGFVILLFVDDEGKVHDVSEYLRRTDRGYTFSAPVTPTGEGAMRDQLIVAIAADRKLGFVRTEVPIPNSAYFSSILKQVVASGADVSIGLSAFRVSPLNLE
jgi:serine/threonine-protein kinase